MNPIFRIIEILLIIVIPLLILYLRGNWNNKEIYLNVTLLPLIWYIFYAPIHEICHIFGSLIVGAEITDYRLFAHFWEGSFGFAYVEFRDGLNVNFSSLIILIFPYILDFISIIAGYFILSKYKIKNSFVFGFTFLILCLRPLYDLIDNYIGIYYNHSDLVLTTQIIGSIAVYLFGFVSISFGIITIINLLKKYKGQPILNIHN
jgi:hypothetical protein